MIQQCDSTTLSPSVSSFSEYTVNWNLINGNGNSECIDCNHLSVNPLFDTQYMITAINEEGCQSIDTILIHVEPLNGIYAPNVFSPNSDGFNDYFYLQSEKDLKVLSLKIFDRWGEILLEQKQCFLSLIHI